MKTILKVVAALSATILCSAASAQTSFSATYSGAGTSGGTCSSTYNISGMEPTTVGKYPVFVYTVGTNETYNDAAAMEAVKRMAAKGYVAATVQYASSQFGDCTVIGAKASCAFNPNSAASAISQLCSRAQADCSKGIVVAGFSQGSVIASLAKNYDARVQAAYAIGVGVQYSTYDLRACMANGNRALASDRLRAVNGEGDSFNGGTASAARSQLKEVTGLDCGTTAYGCLNTNNSGWLIVKNSQVYDLSADHCYMRKSGDCAGLEAYLDPGWQSGTQNWELETNLQWLTGFTTK